MEVFTSFLGWCLLLWLMHKLPDENDDEDEGDE